MSVIAGQLQVPEVSKVLGWVFSPKKSGISRRDAIRHLRIPMRDLDEMTFGLALTPMPGESRQSTGPPPGARDGVVTLST